MPLNKYLDPLVGADDMDARSIKTRAEMAQYLNERMCSTYWDARSQQRLEKSMVKTYCIEAHPSLTHACLDRRVANVAGREYGAVEHDRILHFLNIVGESVQGRAYPSEDESLFVLKAAHKRAKVDLFVDTSDERFWIVHSADRSVDVDWVTDRLIKNTPALDSAWFPIEMLESMTYKGSFRGMGLNFDRRKMNGAVEEESLEHVTDAEKKLPVEYLSLRLWGNKAGDVLRILREENAFPNATTLSSVRIKYWVDESEDEFTLNDIKYNGKITGIGTSFEGHIFLVTDLYRKYKAVIRRIEQEYALRYPVDRDGRMSISGGPFNFVFSSPIENLYHFCDRLLTSAAPFRLWGIPSFLNDSYVRVCAVDLHVGCGLNFEITREFMRVYLPEGSCGNTIARLYTNLQHSYDACVRIEVGNEHDLFD